MAGADPGVIVRRATRFDVVLPAAMRVGDQHADLIRFGPRAGDRSGWIEGDLLDIGTAGAGFMGTTFMPRGTKVVLRVFELGDRDGAPALEVEGTIVRVVMTDRRPGYLLGVGFDRTSESTKEQVMKLIARFSDEDDADPARGSDEQGQGG